MKICKNDGKKFEDSFKFCPLCGEGLVAQSKEEQLMETIEELKKRIEILENKPTIKTKQVFSKYKLSENYKVDIAKRMAKYIRNNKQVMLFKDCFQTITGRSPGGVDYVIKDILKDEYGIKVIGFEKHQRCYVMPSSVNPTTIPMTPSTHTVVREHKQYNFTPEWIERRRKMLQEMCSIRVELKKEHKDWTYQQLCTEGARIYKARQAIAQVQQNNTNTQAQTTQELKERQITL